MPEKITREASLISYIETELDDKTIRVINEAKAALLKAYAKYSNFQVGAALLLGSGEIITASNQENACYPVGLCAERVAFFAAKSQDPDCTILKVAIAARKKTDTEYTFATPCGSCRQVMSEYENNQAEKIKVYLAAAKGKVYASDSIENLLPFKFSDASL